MRRPDLTRPLRAAALALLGLSVSAPGRAQDAGNPSPVPPLLRPAQCNEESILLQLATIPANGGARATIHEDGDRVVIEVRDQSVGDADAVSLADVLAAMDAEVDAANARNLDAIQQFADFTGTP